MKASNKQQRGRPTRDGAGKASAYRQLAQAQQAQREFAQATGSFKKVLALAPDDVEAHVGLAQALLCLDKREEAAASYRRALALAPNHFVALTELGICQRELRQYADAAATYERALELAPNDAACLHDLGLSLHLLGKHGAAIPPLERARALKPDNTLFLNTLAAALFEVGEWQEAVRHIRHALDVGPYSASLHSSLLFMLSHYCSDPAELTAAHLEFGERCEAPLRAQWRPHANERAPERRLRIGFVSADLHNHAVSRFVVPIFERIKNSEQLTLHVYYNNVVEDSVTQRLRGCVAHWNPIAHLDDDAAARQIRADGIDILIDLSGHSASNRLPLFARKPAPVQASWIGYAGTTGLQAMDYYLGDQFYLPEGRYDDQFSEKIVRLPLATPFAPEQPAPPINALPALDNGFMTFGSFHRPSKLSRDVIAQWSRLLRAVPDSKMLLGGMLDGSDEKLLSWFEQEGIARERLILRPRAGMYEYLAQHHEVDVCLSPFPYTGATTLLHALWMGVPTLATVGPTNPSHGIVFPLAHLGLDSFIADSDELYVAIAVLLSQNLDELARLRATMRTRFTSSLLGYPGIAAAGVEHALRLMWQRWCAGLPPAPLRVRLSDLMPEAAPPAGA